MKLCLIKVAKSDACIRPLFRKSGHICVCMYVCICMCMYVCMHVCLCVYVCVYVCMCMYVYVLGLKRIVYLIFECSLIFIQIVPIFFYI